MLCTAARNKCRKYTLREKKNKYVVVAERSSVGSHPGMTNLQHSYHVTMGTDITVCT